MATANKTYDVFITHAPADSHVAREIAGSLESVGLETYHAGVVQPTADISEALWQALAESRALIAIYSPEMPTSAMGMVEIGAATSWNKPVFVLINGPASTKLPPALRDYPAYPLNRRDDIIRAIRAGFEPLTEDEQHILADVYEDLGVSVDHLGRSPEELRDLATRFNKRTGKRFSGERLLSEILRLRKKGQLPRLATRAR